MPSTSSVALSLGPEDTAEGTVMGDSRPQAPGHQPALCLMLGLSPNAAVRLSARPDDRLEHKPWCQTSGCLQSHPAGTGGTLAARRACAVTILGGTCWQHTTGKAQVQLLLFWAPSLCPPPGPPGWVGSQSLVHLEGHSGITQGHCYGSGFLGKDPEVFQTLAQPEKDQSWIPN